MTSFPSTGPITASLDVQWGDLRVVAGDDPTVVVTVTPSDPTHDKDVRAAAATTVSCADGRLQVVGPRNRTGVFNKKYGSVQVEVLLGQGSELDAVTGFGAIAVEGAVGRCRLKSAAGDVRLQAAASADLRTGMGAVTAGRIAGDLYCRTGSGSVHVERIGGRAEVRNSNGDTRIGDCLGALRVKAANGTVTVGHAGDDAVLTSANGDLAIGSAESGAVQMSTSLGRIEIGIAPGTAALLDLSTSFGAVRNELDAIGTPEPAERTVEVRAQTSAGDIDVRRAPALV